MRKVRLEFSSAVFKRQEPADCRVANTETEDSRGESPLFSTPNRAVLEPILADLDRLWEMRHWIPNPNEPIDFIGG